MALTQKLSSLLKNLLLNIGLTLKALPACTLEQNTCCRDKCRQPLEHTPIWLAKLYFKDQRT